MNTNAIRKHLLARAPWVNRKHTVDTVKAGDPAREIHTVGVGWISSIENLRRALKVPVTTWDERLTSVAADELLAQAGIRRKGRKEKVDQAAAVLILQGYLDTRAAPASTPGGAE